MGRIFIGLVKCGAWGCFDEFNRLEEAVLSAVSTQIQAIQTAIRNQSPTCELLEKKVWMHKKYELFVLHVLYMYGECISSVLCSIDNVKKFF